MSLKRKQTFTPREELLGNEWEQLALIHSEAKKPKVPKTLNQRRIITQLVEYNSKKHEYSPVDHVTEKQFVTLRKPETFESVTSSVWDFYQDVMQLDVDSSTHDLLFLVGKKGPRASDMDDLKGKREILVCFQKKQDQPQKSLPAIPAHVISSSLFPGVSTTETISNNSITCSAGSSIQDTSTVIKKSIMPQKLTLTKEDLLALGKTLPEMTWDSAKVRSIDFDLAGNTFAWGEWETIKISKGEKLGEGGFRSAFRCRIKASNGFNDGSYVYKMFHQDPIDHRMANFDALGDPRSEEEAIVELNMKSVQTLFLAKLLSDLFREKFVGSGISVPRYVSGWLLQFDSGVCGSLEEYIGGKFVKYLNNSMDQRSFPNLSDTQLKAIAFAHFTYDYGGGSFMVTDLQGVGLCLTDPEVATKMSYTLALGKGEMVFGAGNLPLALANFEETHKCNKYCELAQLRPIKLHGR